MPMNSLFVVPIAALTFLAATTFSDASAAPRPNIILAMADDQGWRDTDYNADPDRGLKTPHLDQMAGEGIRFDRFYSSSPNCAPTRASILTGRHCQRSGVFNPGFAMPPRELTIAKILQQAGYATAHFGKWHLGPVKKGSQFDPSSQGFDYYLSHFNLFNTNPELSRNGAKPEKFSGDGSEVIVDEALKYVDSVKDSKKPFFLVIWFASCHDKHQPLAKYKDLYSKLPEEWANYFGEITGIDSAMGNLRSGLQSRGLERDTLIWYTSDNGSTSPANEIAGLRGAKGSLWEGGIRVPGSIVWPGHITKPMRPQISANSLDIMPTVLDLLEITVENHEFDGISLWPLIQGREMTERTKGMPFLRDSDSAKLSSKIGTTYTKEQLTDWWHTFDCPVFKEPPPLTGGAAWIEGRWKLHRPRKSGEYELYDIVTDPSESTNLASKEAEVVKDLSAKLMKWQLSANNSLTGADYKTAPKVKIN